MSGNAHGHPGIASVTHPTEKRKLTIAELKRICAFPDDFILPLQHIILQNAKLKVELRNLKRELIPVEEVTHLGAELGAAIRKVVTRAHRVAPSLEGQPVPVIEARLKEEEDDILKQLHTLDERLSEWQRAD